MSSLFGSPASPKPRWRLAAAAGLWLAGAFGTVHAQEVVVQGSTTFNTRLMVPHKERIEAASGETLKVLPNKSSAGVLALLEGRAELAMISGPLGAEMSEVEKLKPGVDMKNLKSHEVSRTRVSFAVNPANRVRSATLEQIRRALLGEITNWSELGGENLPIRVVVVRDGGGVQTTVNSQLLKGEKVAASGAIWVQHGSQVIKVVEQEPGALGMAQLSLALERNLPELATDGAIEQVLALVTVGEPSPRLNRVIEAAREVARGELD